MNTAYATEADGHYRATSAGYDGPSKASHHSPRRDGAAGYGQRTASSGDYVDAPQDVDKRHRADGRMYFVEAEDGDDMSSQRTGEQAHGRRYGNDDAYGGTMDGETRSGSQNVSLEAGGRNEGSMSSYSDSEASSENDEAAAGQPRRHRHHLKQRGRKISRRFSDFFHRLTHRLPSSSSSARARKTPKRPHSSPAPERKRSTFFSRWRWRRHHGAETRSESSGEYDDDNNGDEYGEDNVMMFDEGGASGWDGGRTQQQPAVSYNEAYPNQSRGKSHDTANVSDPDRLDHLSAEVKRIAYANAWSTPQAHESETPARQVRAEGEWQSGQDDTIDRGMAQYDDARMDDDHGHEEECADDGRLSPISLSSDEWGTSLEEAQGGDAIKPNHNINDYNFPMTTTAGEEEDDAATQSRRYQAENASSALTEEEAAYGVDPPLSPNTLAVTSPISQPGQGRHEGHARPAPQFQMDVPEREERQRRLSNSRVVGANEAARRSAMQQQQQQERYPVQTAPPYMPHRPGLPPQQSWTGSGYPQMWPMAPGQRAMSYPSYSQCAMNQCFTPQMSMRGAYGQPVAEARGTGSESSMYMPYGPLARPCSGNAITAPMTPEMQMMMQQEQQRLFALQMQQRMLMAKQQQYITQRLTALDGGGPGSQHHGSSSGHSRMGFKPAEYREVEEKRVKEQEELLPRVESGSSSGSGNTGSS